MQHQVISCMYNRHSGPLSRNHHYKGTAIVCSTKSPGFHHIDPFLPLTPLEQMGMCPPGSVIGWCSYTTTMKAQFLYATPTDFVCIMSGYVCSTKSSCVS
jgi:hypothetical protein